jgi:hypothetical protein
MELGYYGLIGLLRIHTQLGDYHQALQSVSNVQLSKKVSHTFSLSSLSSLSPLSNKVSVAYK